MNLNLEPILRQLGAYPDSPEGRWLVGFSGGLDSTVLLHALLRSKPECDVQAVHVNHGISPRADAWEQHCRAQCQSWGVEFRPERVELPTDGSWEDRARRARYEAFARCMEPGDSLLLAHHRDDQAETMLYRLLRGSGVRGLAGMAAVRPFEGGHIVRPLLDVSRQQLRDYARDSQLDWIEDESNTDETFDRNYLRHRVMPALSARWPEAQTSIARSAQWCAEAQQLLAERAQEDLARLEVRPEPGGASVSRSALLALSPSRRNNCLRYWLDVAFNERVGHQVLQDVTEQLLGSTVSPTAQRLAGSVILCVFDDRLTALEASRQWQPQATTPAIAWCDAHRALPLPGGDSLSWRQSVGEGIATRWLDRPVEVRWRRGGERCHPVGRGHSQTLKKLLQEYRVPTWLRSRLPLVYIEGRLAAVGPYWVCDEFAAPPGEPAVQLQWQV